MIPVDGGAPQPAKGVAPDTPLGWTNSGEWYVSKSVRGVTQVDVVNPWTGARKPWREFHPPRMVGIRTVPPVITPDGRFYAYGYALGFSDLFVVSGVR